MTERIYNVCMSSMLLCITFAGCVFMVKLGLETIQEFRTDKEIAENYAKRQQWVVFKIDDKERMSQVVNFSDHQVAFKYQGSMTFQSEGLPPFKKAKFEIGIISNMVERVDP